MRSLALLVVLFAACVTAPMPQVTADNPNLLSNGNPTDPNRQVQLQGRPCVLQCMKGYRCDPKSGGCEAIVEPMEPRDGGAPWLP